MRLLYALLGVLIWPVTSQLLTTLTDTVYSVTRHCLAQEGIIDTLENVTPIGCARLCIESAACEAFGYQESVMLCRLGLNIADHEIHSSHCIGGETIYTPGAAKKAECDGEDGWYFNSVRNTCIKMFLSPLTRDEAQTNCESHESSLAMWNSKESKDVFDNRVIRNISGWIGDGDAVWVDARWMNSSSRWQWSSGEEVAAELWAPHQPDGNGLCIHLYRIMNGSMSDWSFMLDDISCSYTRQYACEK